MQSCGATLQQAKCKHPQSEKVPENQPQKLTKSKIVKGPESAGKGESLVFKDPDNNLIEIFYQS